MWPFTPTPAAALRERLDSLSQHLAAENPVLVDAVGIYRDLDRIAYRMQLLPKDESFATRISWWPLISILGTFSAGKSTFINQYLGQDLQLTGNQAVDDKFTVICYGADAAPRTLPGMALNADPRFPFYEIGREIERASSGEGNRIDSYLQLKTCDAPPLKGKILIDSPGFDADAQRSSTLRITSHIIDLSDLVLVLFDARHPEPGAMSDTLQHLVGGTIQRTDAAKFLYVLNQIDTAAREDNPEQVVGAWQRAIAHEGLTAGRFYAIYSERAAVPIEDPARESRFRQKRDTDLAAIESRMEEVGVERAYRILGNLQALARHLQGQLVPELQEHLKAWRRTTLLLDAGLIGAVAAVFAGVLWGLRNTGATAALADAPLVTTAAVIIVLGGIHFWSRRMAARLRLKHIPAREAPGEPDLRRAFLAATRWQHSALVPRVRGWSRGTQKRLHAILRGAGTQIQRLNDRFTDPSGRSRATAEVPEPEAANRAEA